MIYYNSSEYRFQLDKTKPRKKFTCPSCGKKTFVKVIDTKTGEYVGDSYGVCDRQTHCGYKLFPSAKDVKGELFISSHEIIPSLRNSWDEYDDNINPKHVLGILGGYSYNKLFKFLCTIYPQNDVTNAFLRYKVGTMDHFNWKGACVFWQIDNEYNVRTGKIMDYDAKTGHRVKDDYSHVAWYHSSLGGDFNLRQCLFGLHLLNEFDESTMVNVVESEKTAIIASISSPKSLFLATGGLQNLRPEVMNVLLGRKITVYPDKGAASFKWIDKINKELSHLDITVSSYLEKKSEVGEGDDMADYLIIKQKSKKT